MKRPFRVKVVVPHGPDAHYFYAKSLKKAKRMRRRLRREIPADVGAQVWIYVETSYGHVRVT